MPIASAVPAEAEAAVRELDGRRVVWCSLGGGAHRGSIGEAEGAVVERAVSVAAEIGVPFLGVLATSGAEIGAGMVGLHAWGRVARAMAAASGVVPMAVVVDGPCISGPALLLGLVDHVVMTEEAFAYVSGPEAVARITGVECDHVALGGAVVHARATGLASLVVADRATGIETALDLLSYLPPNHLDEPPRVPGHDPFDRRCAVAAAALPERANAGYDVRDVLTDVLDEGTMLEVRPRWAPNIVTGFGRLGGRPVGVVANQPQQRAGTIDIAASHKAARFVQSCDAFNVPLVTFVDTPGFEPGKELEWRGMIRHGAQLVHAYADATVPRLCVILRKAYGGAYIVMDSRGMGNDYCLAWPSAEIAVMGAAGAVSVLFSRHLQGVTAGSRREAERARLEAEYTAQHLSPWRAAERGLVDAVIEPEETRRVLADALAALATKRESLPRRRHSNGPL